MDLVKFCFDVACATRHVREELSHSVWVGVVMVSVMFPSLKVVLLRG